MEATEEAQRWLDATLERAFAGRLVDPARRENLRRELARLLLAEAERKAVEWGQGVITTHHLEAALAAYGGAHAFAEPYLRHAEPERVGFWPRALAYVIDAILLGVATTVLFLPLHFLASAGGAGGDPFDSPFGPFDPFEDAALSPGAYAFYALLTLAGVAVDLAYFTLMEARRGQTLGKMALRLRVVGEDGAPVDAGRALVRNLAKINGLLVLLDALIMAIFLRKEKQRVSDRLTRTLVIRDP